MRDLVHELIWRFARWRMRRATLAEKRARGDQLYYLTVSLNAKERISKKRLLAIDNARLRRVENAK